MTHYIVIIDISDSDKEKKYKVVNSLVTARPGEQVCFCNQADEDASVEFDDKWPFDPEGLVVKGKEKSSRGLGQFGHYPFEVYVGGIKAEASKPIIIIYS